MKIKVLQSDGINYREIEGQRITKNFALYDNFSKGKRTYQIDHIPSGRTICQRTFAGVDVAQCLCDMYEDSFGVLLEQSGPFLKEDLRKNATMKKLMAYGTATLLEEQDNPINFSKLTKAKKQVTKDLGG
jgi:hypothetical protein